MSNQATSTRQRRRMARTPGSDTMPTPARQTAEAQLLAAKAQSKSLLLLELLKRKGGATLDQMVEATGWQPHTMRAALTGFRKKGHSVTSEKIEGLRTYRIELVSQ